MTAGILYICTGKYEVFWPEFYASAEKLLMPGVEKQYFVFTDSDKIRTEANIHRIEQQRLGWPKDTLMRFHLFLRERAQLEKMDHLFFFNANYTFTRPIAQEEILPAATDHFLTGQWHPVAYHRKRADFDYETDPRSTACIAPDAGTCYYAGGLIGGRTPEFLVMCETLAANIDADEANGITARWHDESHINKYFSEHPPKRLHPGYCYPQGWYLPFEQKTLLRDKSLLGGHAYLRGQDDKGNDGLALRKGLFKYKLYVRAVLFKILGYSPL